MLKSFPFEFLEGRLDDLCNMQSGVVVKEDDLSLSIRSFYLNCFIYTVQLGKVELLLDRDVSFKYFPVHHALSVPPNADHFLFWVEILLDSRLRRVSWGHPLLFLLHIDVQVPFLNLRDDSVQKELFMTACCSTAGEVLSCDLKTIFFVEFAKFVRHPGSEVFGKSH